MKTATVNRSADTPRAFVMEMSVKIEHLLNIVLAQRLGVKPENTKSFGNTNQALGFNSKANLLLDLEYLVKEDVKKCQLFMEVRNKFAHSFHIDTYKKCFDELNKYTQIKNLFGELDYTLESELESAFIKLTLSILKTLYFVVHDKSSFPSDFT